MRRTVVILAAVSSLALASAAQADPLVTVDDPTGDFSGQYQCGWETYIDEETGETKYRLDENGDRIPVYCNQTGYVSVGPEGVVACNGNPEHTRPDDGSPLVGYIWVGSSNQASNQTFASPGGDVGAGSNHEDADGEPTGDSPCP